jgi:hypothetical protein
MRRYINIKQIERPSRKWAVMGLGGVRPQGAIIDGRFANCRAVAHVTVIQGRLIYRMTTGLLK